MRYQRFDCRDSQRHSAEARPSAIRPLGPPLSSGGTILRSAGSRRRGNGWLQTPPPPAAKLKNYLYYYYFFASDSPGSFFFFFLKKNPPIVMQCMVLNSLGIPRKGGGGVVTTGAGHGYSAGWDVIRIALIAEAMDGTILGGAGSWVFSTWVLRELDPGWRHLHGVTEGT